MKRELFLSALTGVSLVLLLSGSAMAAPSFSIDSSSPSEARNNLGGAGYSDDILTSGAPGGALDIGGPGPQVQVGWYSLGIPNAPIMDLNALSGDGAGLPFSGAIQLYFSVDRGAVGNGLGIASTVSTEAIAGQAAGDIFAGTKVYTHHLLGSPPGPVPAGAPGNTLYANQWSHDLVPTAPQGAGSGNWPSWEGTEQYSIDNLNAYDFSSFNFNKEDTVQDHDVFFSVTSADAAVLAADATPSGADILQAKVGGQGVPPLVFADEATLGLKQGDNLDALVLWDVGTPQGLDSGTDIALFSLAPDSPSLSNNLFGRVRGTDSPGDVFITDFSGKYFALASAESLGLLVGTSSNYDDNLNALEYQAVSSIPEPTTILLLGMGLLGLARLRKRTA